MSGYERSHDWLRGRVSIRHKKLKQNNISGEMNASSPVAASFWFMVCNAIQYGARYLAMPFLVRMLTTEQYGNYSVFLSWINIISVFATLKLEGGGFNNAMYRYADSRDKYTSSVQSISMTGVILCFGVYLLFKDFFNELFGLPTHLSVMIFAQLLFSEAFLVWTAKQRYEYKYKGLAAATAVYSIVSLIAPLVAVLFAPAESRLTVAIYSGAIVQMLFGILFSAINYVRGKSFFAREYWRFALGFNLPLIPHYLSSIILGESDRVMISNLVGSAEAGIYSFVYTISLAVGLVTSSINSAIIPVVYDCLGKKDTKKVRGFVNYLLLAVGILILALVLVAPEVVRLFATEDYYDAIPLIPVIALSTYFTFLYCQFGNVEFFFGANKFIAVASVLAAAANVALNAWLIPVFGYFAAAYTTLVCYMLYSLAHYVFMRIVCKKKMDGARPYNEKVILFISAALLAVAFAILLIYPYWIIRYAIIALIVVFLIMQRGKIKELLSEIKRSSF